RRSSSRRTGFPSRLRIPAMPHMIVVPLNSFDLWCELNRTIRMNRIPESLCTMLNVRGVRRADGSFIRPEQPHCGGEQPEEKVGEPGQDEPAGEAANHEPPEGDLQRPRQTGSSFLARHDAGARQFSRMIQG